MSERAILQHVRDTQPTKSVDDVLLVQRKLHMPGGAACFNYLTWVNRWLHTFFFVQLYGQYAPQARDSVNTLVQPIKPRWCHRILKKFRAQHSCYQTGGRCTVRNLDKEYKRFDLLRPSMNTIMQIADGAGNNGFSHMSHACPRSHMADGARK